MKKKGHQYLDAMRPATRINVPFERNRKKRTQFIKGKILPKRGKNQYVDSNV